MTETKTSPYPVRVQRHNRQAMHEMNLSGTVIETVGLVNPEDLAIAVRAILAERRSSLRLVTCDCTTLDVCPQGLGRGEAKCKIWMQP